MKTGDPSTLEFKALTLKGSNKITEAQIIGSTWIPEEWQI